MPLIKCIDCGRQVSDNAKACPACGCKVNLSRRAALPSIPDELQTLHPILLIVLSIPALLGIGAAVWSAFNLPVAVAVCAVVAFLGCGYWRLANRKPKKP